MANWHYKKNGTEHGPISSKELTALAKSGELQPDDRVKKGGMKKWTRAKNVQGLFSQTRSDEPIPLESPNRSWLKWVRVITTMLLIALVALASHLITKTILLNSPDTIAQGREPSKSTEEEPANVVESSAAPAPSTSGDADARTGDQEDETTGGILKAFHKITAEEAQIGEQRMK